MEIINVKKNIYTSKQPPRRTNGKEQTTIMTRIISRTTPVGYALPATRPKYPGRLVSSHSDMV